MKEELTIQPIASFTRTHDQNNNPNYVLHAMVKVTDALGPVVGLALGNFHIRMGEFDLGVPSFQAHSEGNVFPGFYQITQFFKFTYIDVTTFSGMLLCIQVKKGLQVGTGLTTVSQVEMTQD